MLRFLRIFTFFLIAVTGLYLWMEQKPLPSDTGHETGDVAIGGPFSLRTPEGETVTNDSLKGKPRLVYFGYTYCPDICPTALVAMQHAVKQLGANTLSQIFITVDPQRDTPEHLKEYATNFPGLIALTGSMEEIKEATRAYKVYFQKVTDKTLEKSDDENYLVDHSGFIYLIDAEGRYLAHFPHNVSAEKLEADVRSALKL